MTHRDIEDIQRRAAENAARSRESFNPTLECELLAQHRFTTRAEASVAIFDFIEGWYAEVAHVVLAVGDRHVFSRTRNIELLLTLLAEI